MTRNLNRRKISFLSKKNFIYFLFIFITIFLIFIFQSKKNIFYKSFYNLINVFSENFEYQYINLNVSGIDKVEYSFLEKKLQKYLKSSIFLLPLDKISTEIKENNWIRNIKLSTNFKNTLFIDLDEYKPLGIYLFNNKYFYFDSTGKIIEEVSSNYKDDNLIIFSGKYSNLEAKFIIDIIESLNINKKISIKKITYIQGRRWDIILKNNIKLMLSETSPKKSIQNFMKIEKKLSEVDMNNIKYFDLRNTDKTLINYIE